ncbi:MAG: class I SAM-dependent methyltransferase [Burkholderiales bacterium]|nr:class I SAM-dependent methyltransferase [Burkholderiales bacterium]
MTRWSERLRERFYTDVDHPYQVYAKKVDAILTAQMVLLDAGCGRTAPVLTSYVGRAKHLIGVDLVDFVDVPDAIETHRCDLARMPVSSNSVDLIISRSVFEHLQDPVSVYCEFNRVLKPGGHLVFLTGNMWDYGTLVARAIPNKFHAKIVRWTEGRAEEDTFPTAYRTNTASAIHRLADREGLIVESIEYLNQYPNYLMFNGLFFLAGVAYERITSRVEFLRFLRGWLLVTLKKPVSVQALEQSTA